MISLAVVLVCIILSVIALLLGGFALVLVLALKNSTHKIQWKDPFSNEEFFQPVGKMDEQLKKMSKDLEDDLL